MNPDFSGSSADRKNVLNNPFAVEAIQEEIDFRGTLIDSEYRFTVDQVARFFEVDQRTIERYLSDYEDELKSNGYEVFTGKRLQDAKTQLGTDINVGTKTTKLGLFNFRSFLNLGMLINNLQRRPDIFSLSFF